MQTDKKTCRQSHEDTTINVQQTMRYAGRHRDVHADKEQTWLIKTFLRRVSRWIDRQNGRQA